MRSFKVLIAWEVLSVAALALAGSVQAQSFLQKVFGLASEPQTVQQIQPRARTIPPARLLRRDIERSFQSYPAATTKSDDDIGPPDSGGPYRTMCVRTCDGYYFPVRTNARRANFASDRNACKAACGSEARLFYYSERTGRPDEMMDLEGRKYAELPHAFSYRKALKDGCSCKPVPWSAEAKAQHQQYADHEADELKKDEAFVSARNEAILIAEAAETSGAVAVQWPEFADWSERSQKIAMARPAQSDVSGIALSTGAESETAVTEPKADSGEMATAERAELPPRARIIRAAARPRVERPRNAGFVRRVQYRPASYVTIFGKNPYRYPGDPR